MLAAASANAGLEAEAILERVQAVNIMLVTSPRSNSLRFR